jgi:hypothetical protein
MKNTISCGRFSLPTKPVVDGFSGDLDAPNRFEANIFRGYQEPAQDLMSRT